MQAARARGSAQARYLSFVHQGLNERGLDCEALGDDRRVDADRVLFEYHGAHLSAATTIAPRVIARRRLLKYRVEI